jgi:hypothetical protein
LIVQPFTVLLLHISFVPTQVPPVFPVGVGLVVEELPETVQLETLLVLHESPEHDVPVPKYLPEQLPEDFCPQRMRLRFGSTYAQAPVVELLLPAEELEPAESAVPEPYVLHAHTSSVTFDELSK